MPFFPHQFLPRYLTQAELQAFFAAITEPRDRALFTLIYHYGLRVGEVALLARGDVDFDRHRIVVKRLKGGFWTERPLFAASESLLGEYLHGLPCQPSDPLFCGRTGPLGRRQIQDRFCRYREHAGLDPRYTAHSLRHSIATHLLDAGASLEFVQDHLGHRSIRSTSIYARITDHHRVALFRKLEASRWIVDPVATRRPPPKDLGV